MEKTQDRSRNSSRHLHRLFNLTLALIAAMSWVAFSVYSGKPAAAASTASVAINPVAVVVTSAITFETTAIAPNSLVSAFGTLLITPDLIGTTVKVNGVPQQLLSVTKFGGYDQVNFVLSISTAVGTAMIEITSGDGTVSQGTFQVRLVAPVVPSANPDLQGPPNALLRRFKVGVEVPEPPPYQFNAAIGRNVTRPIDLTPPGDVVFLSIFLSGISKVPNTDGNPLNGGAENIRVIIGGEVLTPTFAGLTGAPGQDQIDVILPRSLIGAGLVSCNVTADGFASNSFELEFANTPIISGPTFSGFSPASVLAGATLTINGSGFDPQIADNQVRIAGLAANVISATTTQLQVTVPFGTQSGNVNVRTPQGEGTSASAITMRTSISGVVQDTASQPLVGMTARISSSGAIGLSDANGNFIVPDLLGGAALVEIDGTSIPASPPYPLVLLKQIVTNGRDNQFSSPIYLQQATGPTIGVGSGGGEGPGDDEEESDPPASGPHAGTNNSEALAAQNPKVQSISTGKVTFEVQPGTRARYPNGVNSGILTLTEVSGSHTPIPMPHGAFSSLVAQITVFGVELTPGATLTFNNADNLPPGSTPTLWMLDQRRPSATVGQFIPVGLATVSADGKTVRTATGAVTSTSIYFVSPGYPLTTITGHVVDCSGNPLAGATVSVLGRSDLTDASGSFVIGGVAVTNPNAFVTVEASLAQNGQALTAHASIFLTPGGVVSVRPDLVLFTPNCRPRAFSQTVTACSGRPRFIYLLATERSDGVPPRGFPPISIFPPPSLKYVIDRLPTNGVLKGFSFSVLTFSPYVTYISNTNFLGTDRFIFSVINNVGIRSNLAFVTIRVVDCP